MYFAWKRRSRSARTRLFGTGAIFAAGALVATSGLGIFAPNALASGGSSGSGGSTTSGSGGTNIPTGARRARSSGCCPSPRRCHGSTCWRAMPVSSLDPAPTEEANTTQQLLDPRPRRRSLPATPDPSRAVLRGPCGRTRTSRSAAQVAVEASQEGAKANALYNPAVAASYNCGIDPLASMPPQFHPGLPVQSPNSVWTFNGTIPPKLAHRPLWRAHPLPASQQAALRRQAEQRLRPAHHLDARAQRPPRRGERRLHRRVLLPRPVLRLSLADRARRVPLHQPRRHRPHGLQPQRQRRPRPGPGRLARDDEHALVPRPHVQLHLAERLQGQCRHVQHLQRRSIAATRPSRTA